METKFKKEVKAEGVFSPLPPTDG